MDVQSDDDDDHTTNKHHDTKKHHLPITPHPPSSFKPQPPSKQLKRPHTAGDFRSRRYRQRSVEEPMQYVGTSHDDADNDRKKIESCLESRQPDHLIDVNGQYQNTHSLKETVSSGYDPEHGDKKTPLK